MSGTWGLVNEVAGGATQSDVKNRATDAQPLAGPADRAHMRDGLQGLP